LILRSSSLRAALYTFLACNACALLSEPAHAAQPDPSPPAPSDSASGSSAPSGDVGPQIQIPLPDPSSSSARASLTAPVPPGERTWDEPHWEPRKDITFSTFDYAVTASAVGTVIAAQIVKPQTKHAASGVLFDEDVRDFLRARSLNGRYAVRDASDVGVSLASTWPFLVDALVTTYYFKQRPDVALKMALVSAESFSIAAAIQSVANDVASRERPYGRLCGKEIPEQSVDCEPTGSTRYRSFFSGHTTLAFTSASILCVDHMTLGLLGTGGDVATCIGGYTIATMTSVFRIMADMHYATDVTVGALVGTSVGLVVPWLHFKDRNDAKTDKGGLLDLDMRVAPVGQGVGVVGTF